MLGTDDRVKTIGALVRTIKPIQPLLQKQLLIKQIKTAVPVVENIVFS
jgi:hypothetical protein